jgi:Rnl2 family RNA ligase
MGKDIDWWLTQYPNLRNESFTITEKIHGTNIQLIFTPDGMTIASRNRVLPANVDHMGVRAVVDGMRKVLSPLAEHSVIAEETVTLYGELFGPGIMKGVNYGEEKRLLFFDIAFNGVFAADSVLRSQLDCTVPVLAVVSGLEDALNFASLIPSRLGPDVADNYVEGVVIKPHNNYVTNQGSRFVIKKKNDEFKEVAAMPKLKPPPPDEIVKLHNEFMLYVNDNRLQSVFSKEGEIEEPQQFGHYIRLVISDAKEEFEKDFGDSLAACSKKELRMVYNAGGAIVKMLKEYL